MIDRDAEGKKIIEENRIIDNKDGSYSIKGTEHNVTTSSCSCPDKTIRRVAVCKLERDELLREQILACKVRI